MQRYDVIFVGGGLANGLAAYCLHRKQPSLKILLLEREAKLGGVHTWSFHDSDLPSGSLVWLTPFITRHWEAYEVRFPKFTRILPSGYNSIRSDQFHDVLCAVLGDRVHTLSDVSHVEKTQVRLSNGEVLHARLVLDGRGWDPSSPVTVAYQKFLGQHLRFESPHGISQPVLMDATCTQVDGYRFFYLLPWSEDELFVEDTHYSDGGVVDRERYRAEIGAYCAQHSWNIKAVEYEEVGSLPIPLGGELPGWDGGVIRTGVGAGLFHATTGYSLPNAVTFAEALADVRNLEQPDLFEHFFSRAHSHWSGEAFFRFLNRMLFHAAVPSERYRVLQRFYKLPPSLIERFYGGRLNRSDYLRLLIGKPPVPVWSAIRCLSPRERVA